jgi:hypothetical protein
MNTALAPRTDPSLFTISKDGAVQPHTAKSIDPKWLPIITAGTVVQPDKLTDLDLIAVTKRPLKRSTISIAYDQLNEAALKIPTITHFDVMFLSKHAVAHSPMRPLVQLMSHLVWGSDIHSRLPPVYIQKDITITLYKLRADLKALLKRLAKLPPQSLLPERVSVWLGKRLTRSGMELVAPKAMAYSRSVALCTEQFSRIYPSYAPHMNKALSMIVDKPPTVSEAKALIIDLGFWICDEWDKS